MHFGKAVLTKDGAVHYKGNKPTEVWKALGQAVPAVNMQPKCTSGFSDADFLSVAVRDEQDKPVEVRGVFDQAMPTVITQLNNNNVRVKDETAKALM